MRVAAHRLRARYRELLREEVGRTTDDPAAIDEEIADLMAALSAAADRSFAVTTAGFFLLPVIGEIFQRREDRP